MSYELKTQSGNTIAIMFEKPSKWFSTIVEMILIVLNDFFFFLSIVLNDLNALKISNFMVITLCLF